MHLEAKPTAAILEALCADLATLKPATQTPSAPVETDEDDDYRARAKSDYECDGEIEIDDNAVVSIGEDGAYVQAWVFVRKSEEEDEEEETSGEDLTECQNCAKIQPERDLKEIKDFDQRVEPGEAVPVGECPGCGSLCHPVAKAVQA